MPRTFGVPVVALVVGVGCATTTQLFWVNADRTHSFKVDSYECERDARVIGLRGIGVFRTTTVEVDEEFMDRCLEARGWTKVEREAQSPPPEAALAAQPPTPAEIQLLTAPAAAPLK